LQVFFLVAQGIFSFGAGDFSLVAQGICCANICPALTVNPLGGFPLKGQAPYAESLRSNRYLRLGLLLKYSIQIQNTQIF